MKPLRTLDWLILLVGLLAIIAAGAGLFWPANGEPYAFTTHRGEEVIIAGRGLYRFDTVSSAAQEQASDAVTLLIGLPLLAVSTWLAHRGSLRGKLLLMELGIFPSLTLLNLVMAVLLLINVDRQRSSAQFA